MDGCCRRARAEYRGLCRRPELQTGDYTQLHGTDQEAQAWVASYIGETLMVYVDPRDPSRSVLRNRN
jgi:hypothetical protein